MVAVRGWLKPDILHAVRMLIQNDVRYCVLLLLFAKPIACLPQSFMQSELDTCMQDDIMYCNLTVEENLLFSARYRLPVHYTHAQHVYYVERAIQVRSTHASLLGSLLIMSTQQSKCSAAFKMRSQVHMSRLSVELYMPITTCFGMVSQTVCSTG